LASRSVILFAGKKRKRERSESDIKGKILLCLLSAILLLSQTARARELCVTVDGAELPGAAFAIDGTTYVPLVPLLDALGGWEANWDQEARTATADTGLFSLTVSAQQSHVLANGFAYDIRDAILLYDGSTYVPLRSMANLLGADVTFVDWDSPVAVSTGQAAAYTEEDLYWLSRIISAESQGESLLGQVAVGNVILNRTASDEFPDSVKAVIFDQKNAVQFEPVANGTIYDEPTEQSVLAAQLALNGARAADGCLYFFNPALSQGLWVRQNRTYFGSIGCHVFYQ